MVKNVRSSKSTPHLSRQDTTTDIVPGRQIREDSGTFETEVGALSLQEDREVSRRAAGYVQEALQNSGSDQGGSDGQTGYNAIEALRNYNQNGDSLHRSGKTIVPQRLPGQSTSHAVSNMPLEIPSLDMDDDLPHTQLGTQWTQWDDVNSKSLFEKFVEDYPRRPGIEDMINDEERSRARRYDAELRLRKQLEQEILIERREAAKRTVEAAKWRFAEKRRVAEKRKAIELFSLKSPEEYTQPFCEFLTENPTVFHAVDYFEQKLEKAGFKKLSERREWGDILTQGGKYFVSRNGSSVIAFTIGTAYKGGNGVAMIGGHIDALTAKLKPVSNKKTTAGYVQLGVAPFAGALNSTWWDRDLGIGGKVLVRDPETGKTVTKLVKLGWPIARIPTLAPHFGRGLTGSENKETEMVPIIGLDNSDLSQEEFKNFTLGDKGSFVSTQPPRLVRAISKELNITDSSSIVNWELELYDIQPAQTGGLDKEFIFGGRIDDKLCSWAAIEALLASSASKATGEDSIIKLVSLFDDEEIGSLLYQGARGNFLPATIERVVEAFTPGYSVNTLSRTYANSFLVSADVIHAVNPNFLGAYLENHAPRLNVGLAVSADSNGHMTTNSVSMALLTRIAEKNGDKLQTFMIRNDSRSGGTIGPVLSSAMGVRAIDAGIPQLSMHSIRATTGNLDPGLGVKIFAGFFEHFESVDKEFE